MSAPDRPLVLVHPALPGIERLLQKDFDARPAAAFTDDEIAHVTAAAVIGSIGLPDDMLARLTNLSFVQCLSAGYDGVDAPALRARGVRVANCADVNSEDVADLALGLLLSATRRIAEGDRLVRAGQWQGPLAFPPVRRVKGQRLGIVGFGAIGRAIAERAAAFGLEIRWTGPRPKPDARFPYEPDLRALAAWADILAVATKSDVSTEKLINAGVLEALGPDGVLINVSRGAVVDEDALILALRSNKIRAAGLDVMSVEPTPPERWADLPNVTLTPHIGGGVREALIAVNQITQDNLRRHFAGEPLTNLVN